MLIESEIEDALSPQEAISEAVKQLNCAEVNQRDEARDTVLRILGMHRTIDRFWSVRGDQARSPGTARRQLREAAKRCSAAADALTELNPLACWHLFKRGSDKRLRARGGIVNKDGKLVRAPDKLLKERGKFLYGAGGILDRVEDETANPHHLYIVELLREVAQVAEVEIAKVQHPRGGRPADIVKDELAWECLKVFEKYRPGEARNAASAANDDFARFVGLVYEALSGCKDAQFDHSIKKALAKWRRKQPRPK